MSSIVPRISIFWVLILAAGAGMAPARAGTPEECVSRAEQILGFDHRLLSRFSEETELSFALSSLMWKARSKLGRDCEALSEYIFDAFLDYGVRRQSYLLAKSELDAFQHEQFNLYAVARSEFERERIRKQLGALKPQYAKRVHESLLAELVGSPWEHYQRIPIQIEDWSDEWARGLGRPAPAAVDLETARVALRVMEYDALHLKIFLFHELSHLAAHSGLSIIENETFAWSETLRYLDHLEAQGIRIPALFQSIRANIRTWGLERWVEMIVRSRAS